MFTFCGLPEENVFKRNQPVWLRENSRAAPHMWNTTQAHFLSLLLLQRSVCPLRRSAALYSQDHTLHVISEHQTQDLLIWHIWHDTLENMLHFNISLTFDLLAWKHLFVFSFNLTSSPHFFPAMYTSPAVTPYPVGGLPLSMNTTALVHDCFLLPCMEQKSQNKCRLTAQLWHVLAKVVCPLLDVIK